ncbi:MAG: O-antigen ligase family protein [Bacillota bacterium]
MNFWKQRSLSDKIILFLLSLMMLYPAIDYTLRNILPIPLLGSFWDELTLVSLLALTGINLIFNRQKRTNRVSAGIGLLMLAGLAYTVLDLSDFGVNIEGYRAMFQYMLVFFAGFYLVRNNDDAKLLLGVAVLLGTLLALHGIYQYITDAPMPARWVNAGEALRTRAFSIINSPNALGSQMAFLTPIALGLAAAEKTWAKKLMWFAAAGLMGLCLVFTFSRGAWLAFAGALAVIGIIYDRRLLIAGIIAMILVAVFVPSVSTRFTALFTPEYFEKSAGSGRIKRWFDAYDQMRMEPLFGVGLGHYGGAVANRHFSSISVDNYYMKTLAETGLLGLSLFLWLISTALRQGYRAWQTLADPRWRYVAAGLFGGLLAIVLHNGVENIFEIPYLNTYFWLAMGLLAAMPYNEYRAGGVGRE